MRGLESESRQPLATVSLNALVTKNQQAIDTLIEAACSDGCFFLDLSDRNDLFTLADEVVEIADAFFDLPEEEKLLYEMDKFTNLHMGGYKAVGKHSGVKQGKKDAFENFLVALNPLLGLDENLLPWPKVIHRHLDLFRSFEQECHRICQQILAALNNVLDETNLPFEENHRLQKPTTTALAMLKYPPSSTLKHDNAGHMAHTDVGSLTLLFTKSPGLQAFSEQTQSWLSVTPRPGSVIVNVGDALSFMSGQRLKSCLHRVVSMTNSTRFSLAYFQRPELDATFQDGDGRAWTGESWHRAKYKLFRADNEAQASSSLLTGRKNFLGHVDEQVRRRIAV